MSEELTASSAPAGPFFSRFQFKVPEFQREYAWRARDEVTDFFEDLQKAIKSDFYFLGLVVLTGTGRHREVVDGQQRILTLSLLAAALRKQAERLQRAATVSDINTTFLFALDYEFDEQVPRVSLASPHDQPTFEKLVLNGTTSGGSAEDPSSGGASSLLRESYAQLEDLLAKDLASSEDEFKRVGAWTRFLKDSLHFAVFDHPNPGSAYRVFEVVNTRGRGLTPSDLIKSYLLSKATDASRQNQYERWLSLTEKLRDIGQVTSLPQFIRHSISARERHIQPRDLYDEITNLYPDRSAVGKLLKNLEADIDLYVQMLDPTQSGPASPEQLAVFSALSQLGVATLRPILLALSHAEEDEKLALEFLKLVLRRIVVGNLGTGAVERRLGSAASAIAKGKPPAAVLEEFEDLNPERDAFVTQLATRSLNKRVLQYVHATALKGSADTAELDHRHLHQIRPRNAVDWGSISDEEATTWASTIGNTVLSTSARRPRNSNSWEGFNTLLLPTATTAAESIVAKASSWTTEELKAHGEAVAEVAADVWYP